jgi:hypothetical protein
LIDLHGNEFGPPTEEAVYDAKTKADGVCETPRVAEGNYVLRLTPGADGVSADEPVTVLEGRASELEIRLRSLRVGGKVYRGSRPAGGLAVRIARRDDLARHSSTYLELITDSEGEYRGTVWSPGEYSFVVMNPARSAVGTVRRAMVGDDGAEVDLYLNAYEITGRVHDDEQQAIPEATVLLTRDSRYHRATKTTPDGTFAFPMDGEGMVRLNPQKAGYQPGEPVEFQLIADTAPRPVVLTMKKLPSVKGTVFWASGLRASGVGVGSFQMTPGRAPAPLGAQRTDNAGAFEVPRAPAGMTQLFAVGSGCPLLMSSVPPETDEVVLRCSAESAGVQFLLRDPGGTPRSHESLILRWEGALIPRAVLRDHLFLLGLPREADGTGRLSLAALPPGVYDVFLGRGASEDSIAAGLPNGYLTSVQLAPFDRPEIEITIQTP